jgi:hypothetical protein
MRHVLASLMDAAVAALLGLAGFRLGLASAPCSEPGNCFAQVPLILLGIVVGVLLYFGVGYLLWRSTPGERLFLRD